MIKILRCFLAVFFGWRTATKRPFVNSSALLSEEVRRANRKNRAFQRLVRMRKRKGILTFSFSFDRRERENRILPIVREEDN